VLYIKTILLIALVHNCVFAQEIKLKNTKQSPEVVTFVKKLK
jgi:hypothetical protein